MLHLSIIIVNWNSKDVLRDCLCSIRKNVTDVEYEIIIVDNNSNDGSVEMVEAEFSECILIKNLQNLGYGKANNQGIMRAKGKYVLILNPDTVVLSGAVEEMCRFLEENHSIGACGPKILDSDFKPFQPMIYDPTLWELFGKDTFLRKLFPELCMPRYSFPLDRKMVQRLSGCCFLARKEALTSAGFFNEEMFLFFEEADLFFRLRGEGWTVYYLPDLSIVHLHGKSVSLISRFREEFLTRKSSLIYFRNRYGFIPSLFLNIFLISSYLLYLITLEMLFLISMKRIHKDKKAFYRDLLKLTSRSLFGLD